MESEPACTPAWGYGLQTFLFLFCVHCSEGSQGMEACFQAGTTLMEKTLKQGPRGRALIVKPVRDLSYFKTVCLDMHF